MDGTLRRRLIVATLAAAAVIALVAVAVIGGIAWYFASALDRDGLRVERSVDEFDLVVTAVGSSWIELRHESGGGKEWRRDGTYRLLWDGGEAPAGGILELRAESVRRSFAPPADGGPEVGTRARLDGFAFGEDPGSAFGIDFENVVVHGELGDMPAWLIPGDPAQWTIMVHGRNSRRQEALRALPVIQQSGSSILVITYRNDVEAPASPDHRYGFGATEWRDLEAAVDFACGQGAEDLLLVGYSMGGAIVVSFMARSEQSDIVGAIVLDAPMLSFESSVDLAASRRGLPGFLTALAKGLAGIRFGIDWGGTDFRREAEKLDVPVLLFHGTEDDRTPVGDSDRLAAARPDTVTYERFEGAAHVRSWNVDPERYEAALASFVQKWRGNAQAGGREPVGWLRPRATSRQFGSVGAAIRRRSR